MEGEDRAGGARSYAVVGTGAVGGFYGLRLAAAGHPVHFLVRSDYEHVRRHGLRLDSPDGDVHLERPLVYRYPTDLPRCDVVLVAVKTTANHLLGGLLPPLLGERTAVVTLQNGLGIEDALARLVGDRPIVGGLCFICSNRIGPGHVRHIDYGRVGLGEHRQGGRPAGTTPLLEALVADFRAAGVPAHVEEDLVLARWRKLLWNVPFNALSVLLDALPQELLADRHARALVRAVMSEVQAGAAACGRPLPEGSVDRLVRDTQVMKPYLTSMKLDFDARRPLEIEAILAAPARASRAAGTPLARVEALHDQLAFLDARNRGVAAQTAS